MKLLYFAGLRQKTGVAEEQVMVPPEVRDVATLLVWLAARGPGFAAALADPAAVKVAVNQDYAGPQTSISADDEVALFPPVTGG
jgi:molybdopterin synthase sulfur carrier subunit